MKQWRGMTPAEFYAARDLRTQEYVGPDVRATARVCLSTDENEARTLSGQVCFLELVNMTSRWCRSVRLVCPEVDLRPEVALFYGCTGLLEAAIKVAEAADPFIDVMRTGENELATAHVHVGLIVPEGAFPVLGRGWLALAGPDAAGAGAGDENALGAVLAACLGACYALRQALDVPENFERARVSLWNLGSGSDALQGPCLRPGSLGRLCIVGLGAVGGSIAYLLPWLTARPTSVDLIDADPVELSNLNRVPLFVADDVDAKKVDVAARVLSRFGVNARAVPAWFSEAEVSLKNYDLFVPAANERGVQMEIMRKYPPIMIAASTGSDWDIYLQRHIPLKEDCLECRLPTPERPVQHTCSDGELVPAADSSTEPLTGGLPFLSMAAAVLAVAEMAKLAQASDYPLNENFVTASFQSVEVFAVGKQCRPKPCVFCWSDGPFWATRAEGLFAALSK